MAFKRILRINLISIHAPSRERLKIFKTRNDVVTFQSTLPRGSDTFTKIIICREGNFNPRSLAGATRQEIL